VVSFRSVHQTVCRVRFIRGSPDIHAAPREDLRDRLIGLVGQGRLTLTTKALDEAGERISRYLLRQLFINAGFGAAIAIGCTS